CVRGCSGRDGELPAKHFLVNRFQSSAAMRHLAEYAKDTMLRVVDDADHMAAIPNSILVLGLFDAEQHSIAEAGSFAGPGLARRVNEYFRRGAMHVLIPFVGCCDEIAVAVPCGDVGQNGGGKGAGMVQFLAPSFDRSFVCELAQQTLQIGTHCILQAEGAGDLTGADLAGLVSDEGENVGLGWERRGLFRCFVQNGKSCAETAPQNKM